MRSWQFGIGFSLLTLVACSDGGSGAHPASIDAGWGDAGRDGSEQAPVPVDAASLPPTVSPSVDLSEPTDGTWTDEQLALLDSMEAVVGFDPLEQKLPNGLTLRAYAAQAGLALPDAQSVTGSTINKGGAPPTGTDPDVNMVIAPMVLRAAFLAQYKPAGQDRLFYKYGAHDESFPKSLPPSGTGLGHCADLDPTQIVGLDCSGLIYMVARAAGLQLVYGTSHDLAKGARWEAAIPSDWNIQVHNVTSDAIVAGYQMGDVLYWAGQGHIAMAMTSGDTPIIVDSHGNPGKRRRTYANRQVQDLDEARIKAECEGNRRDPPLKGKVNRGASYLAWDKFQLVVNYAFPDVVLRVEEKCEGPDGRCDCIHGGGLSPGPCTLEYQCGWSALEGPADLLECNGYSAWCCPVRCGDDVCSPGETCVNDCR